MNVYLADGSTLELNKEQIKIYKQDDPLYLQNKIQQRDQVLNKIEEVCKNGVYDEFRMPLDECSVILDIINKVKEVDNQSIKDETTSCNDFDCFHCPNIANCDDMIYGDEIRKIDEKFFEG